MGQKVNPHGLRVGIIKDWDSQWFVEKKDFAANVKEDNEIRKVLKKKYYQAAISKIAIEKAATKITITIYTARPGVLIGKQGSEIEVIKKTVAKICTGKQISINISEVKKADADAQLVAEGIAAQLEKRVSFRRAMKQAIGRSMRSGVKGVKVMVSGRLDGAEIARSESYHEGSIPLQTLRADIEYGFAEAHTTFGVIGIKCWIYKGEVIGAPKKKSEGGQA
ncbi:MAG: 30S ribosomal protein S3 [Clostridia bacterium]|nr:30S ribosomal protein S3 [Clostridia bacterium]MBR2449665.1 30S ribosomal protein S3 [Clostridia bacterium]